MVDKRVTAVLLSEFSSENGPVPLLPGAFSCPASICSACPIGSDWVELTGD